MAEEVVQAWKEGDEQQQPLIPTSMVPPKTHSIRVVHAGLVVVQLGYAGLQMFSRVALDAGLNQFLLSMYRNMIAFAILGPLAYYFERGQRPRMSLSIFGGLNLLALTGVVGSQQLFLAGLQLTSPLMAAVSQNMIPVFTFLLAAALGFEEVNMRRREGVAKVVGTAVCIGGAVTMSVYKGMALFGAPDAPDSDVTLQPLIHLASFLHHDVAHFSVNKFHLGLFFLVLNCVSWAVYLTCQAPVLRMYPALLSMTAATYFFGFIQVGILGVISAGKLHFAEFRLTSLAQIVGVLYAALIASTLNLLLQSWCVVKGGPFIVSLYVPMQMVMVAILSVLLLKDTLYMGIVLGGLLTVLGFYLVVWGQGLERRRKRVVLAQILEPHHDVFKVDIRQLDQDLKEPFLSRNSSSQAASPQLNNYLSNQFWSPSSQGASPQIYNYLSNQFRSPSSQGASPQIYNYLSNQFRSPSSQGTSPQLNNYLSNQFRSPSSQGASQLNNEVD